MRPTYILILALIALTLAGCDAADSPVSPDVAASGQAAASVAKSRSVRYDALVMSSQSVCGLAKGGTAYCWGLNNYGQLGDGTTDDFTAQPRIVAGGHTFKQIAHSYTHGCGLADDRRLWCWGANESGQLGTASPLLTRLPVEAGGGRTYTEISVGAWHTCALADDPFGIDTGMAFCWGSNAGLQLGINDIFPSSTSVPQRVSNLVPVFDLVTERFPPLRFRKLISNAVSTCGLSEGYDPRTYLPAPGFEIWKCWGSNYAGLFGNGEFLVTPIYPKPALTTLDPASVRFHTYGDGHLCVIAVPLANPLAPKRAYCAGVDTDGQLGDGATEYAAQPYPVEVIGGIDFKSVSAGSVHTCALNSVGAAYCWGANDLGQLGTGTTTASDRPVAVSTTLRFREIYAGNRYSCALTKQDEAYCWGRNEFGELGNGLRDVSLIPVRVIEP
jgi:hypothetical protein